MPAISFMTVLTVSMRVLVLLFTRVDDPSPAMIRVIRLTKLASVVSLAATVAAVLGLVFHISGGGATATAP